LQFWFDAVLPVPDRRFSDSDDLGDFSLEETEVHSFLTDMVTDGHGIGGIAREGLFL